VTAVQEIQAAIDELTKLRDAATPGQRGFSADWFDGSRQCLVAVERGMFGDFRSAGRIATFDGPHLARARDDGMLITTLHRTIDAQLVILELAVAYGELSEGEGSRFITAAKLLARAINGTPQ